MSVAFTASILGVWIHFQGKQLCQFYFCVPYQCESTFKGYNLLLEEKIIYFSNEPFMKGFIVLKDNIIYFSNGSTLHCPRGENYLFQ